MNGSKTNDMNRAEVLAAVRAIPDENDFVWDGIDEDDRPLTEQELQTGLKQPVRLANSYEWGINRLA